MKILITGASGFVGSHLVDKLLSHGHEVFALVRTPSKMIKVNHPSLIIIKGELNTQSPDWISMLPHDLQACIHTAGIVHSFEENQFDRINHLATSALLKALEEKFNGPFKFLLISSLAAAGPSFLDEKKDETQPDFPISAYGLSKKNAEIALKNFSNKNWINSIIRPPMVIGPRDQAVLDIFKMVRDGFILLPGIDSKRKQYSFVCVHDLVETILLQIESDKSLLLYSAHESTVSFEQMIQEIKKQLHKKRIIFLPIPFLLIKFFAWILKLVWRIYPHSLRLTPDKIKELQATSWTCDARESQMSLGQTYHYDFSKTVAITLRDYKERGWI